MWCSSCIKDCHTVVSGTFISCGECGRVISQDEFTEEATFQKNAAGQSQLAGNIVRSVGSEFSASRENTIANAVYGMSNIATALGMDTSDAMVNAAKCFFVIALERNFTRGRKSDQVQAACLYIACRDKQKPYLLIDFSEYLKINVYVLGAVFLQLCQLLSLTEHPIVQKPVDPSLFIHKFSNGYFLLLSKERIFSKFDFSYWFARGTKECRTALLIIASMKRDWMQTDRKPSGLCGAALYISALSHGLKCSKSDIINIVHICEATLTKRLIEFENTESGSLTIEELNVKPDELEKERSLTKLNLQSKSSSTSDLLCKHNGERNHFANGLCEECYDELIQISGGLDGGADPPAFQRAENERMAKTAAEESADAPQIQNRREELNFQKDFRSSKGKSEFTFQSLEQGTIGADRVYAAIDEGINATKSGDESETLSDIDDTEVEGYLHNEEEKHYKKIIWEEMNKEYVEEQAAKEAAKLAAEKEFAATFQGTQEELDAALKLAADAAAAVAKSRKEKQLKRAAEAARQMLTKKRPNSKINFKALELAFATGPEQTKKSRVESEDEMLTLKENQKKSVKEDNHEETGVEDDYEGGDYGVGDYGDDLYHENAEEEYNYAGDFEYDGY